MPTFTFPTSVSNSPTTLKLDNLPLLKEKLNSLSSNSPVDVNDIEGKVLKPLPQSRNFANTIVGNPSSVITPTNLFTDVNEITLNNGDYYPNNQPLLANVDLDFTKASTTSVGTTPLLKQYGVNTVVNVAKTYVENSIGGFIGGDRPQRLISFSYTRPINGIGQFTLVLFDPTWTEIEEKLVKNKGEFRLKYGYLESETLSSPWYNFKAFQYKVDFKMQGVILTISGLGTGWQMNIGPQYKGYEGYKISEIVKDIADQSGLFTDTTTWVEETMEVEELSDMFEVGYIRKKFCQTAETNFQFVLNKLVPYARNKAGQGNYVFFFDRTSNGDTILHFHTPYFKPKASAKGSEIKNAQKIAQQLANGGRGIGEVPGFTLFKDKNSPVINFNPDWRMSTVQLAGGGGTFNTIIDANTKQVLEIKSDLSENNKVIQATDNKPNIVEENPKDYVATKQNATFFISKDQYSRYAREIKAKNDAGYSTRIIGAIRASLDIIGTPKFNGMDRIAVLTYVPSDESKISNTVNAIIEGKNVLQSITKKNVHWISGYFRILKITDKISAGSFVTSFELVTDTRGQVADTPVDMDQKK